MRPVVLVPMDADSTDPGEGTAAAGAAAGAAAEAEHHPSNARFRQPGWLPRDDADPFIFTTHFQLLLPTFSYLVRNIRAHALAAGGDNEWDPRQNFGAISSTSIWIAGVDGIRRPHQADIIRLSDDDNVRTWLAVAPMNEILRVCVIFHQLDEDGMQTPPPPFTEYLPETLYQDN